MTNVNYTHALLIHHKKLDRWLQPGGHVENDTNILETALREAKEETGINDFQIPLENIFDIDIHTIPAIKKEREHYHYDVRFLLVADEYSPITISHESNDLKWFSLAEISAMNEGPSIQRMVDKTLAKYAGIK
ncbi:MAG: NUDIX hydrolase [Gammaproteobacteria bacterium]